MFSSHVSSNVVTTPMICKFIGVLFVFVKGPASAFIILAFILQIRRNPTL